MYFYYFYLNNIMKQIQDELIRSLDDFFAKREVYDAFENDVFVKQVEDCCREFLNKLETIKSVSINNI